MKDSVYLYGRKELDYDALDTFYLRLYGRKDDTNDDDDDNK